MKPQITFLPSAEAEKLELMI